VFPFSGLFFSGIWVFFSLFCGAFFLSVLLFFLRLCFVLLHAGLGVLFLFFFDEGENLRKGGWGRRPEAKAEAKVQVCQCLSLGSSR
jgi:hypothetical protein